MQSTYSLEELCLGFFFLKSVQKKATIIVSKRIVRQATERNQSLGQYIRENKLRLVDPTQDDLKRVGSRQSSSKRIESLRRGSTTTERTKPSYKFREAEDTKYDSFDSYRKQNSRVLADPHKINKMQKRRLTLEGKDIYESEIPMRTVKKLLKKSKTSNLDLAKIKRVKTLRPEQVAEKLLVQGRKMNLNDWMLFIFLIILTIFGVVLS